MRLYFDFSDNKTSQEILMVVSDNLLSRAQFHKGLLNIEDSMLLKLDLNRPLVATTEVFH